MLGMAEMVGHFLLINPQYTIEESANLIMEFIMYGLLKRGD